VKWSTQKQLTALKQVLIAGWAETKQIGCHSVLIPHSLDHTSYSKNYYYYYYYKIFSIIIIFSSLWLRIKFKISAIRSKLWNILEYSFS
jgi:hypothetical protein